MENTINHKLFWDVDKNTLDILRHKRFIIERILQFGMPGDIKWLLSAYSEREIIDAVIKSKTIDKKTANFWRIHYEIDEDKVLCLNRHLINKQFY